MRRLIEIIILLVLVSVAVFVIRSRQRDVKERQEATEQLDENAGLRQRAQERVTRMKAEGWKNEENVSMEEIMKMAETQIQFDNHKQAITLLERALFREPDNLDIEAKIEQQEEMLGQSQP